MAPESEAELRRIKEILWGGPEGEGLVHTVAKLALTVADLSNIVSSKADVVHGEDGEPISLRKVFDEIQSFKQLVTRTALALAVIGLTTILVVGHSLQVAYAGH